MWLTVLLTLTASAAQPWEAQPQFEPQLQWVPHAAAEMQDTPTARPQPSPLRRAGRAITATGVGTIAAAAPAGLAVYGLSMQGCDRNCIVAPIAGLATTGLMVTGGTLTAVSGMITSAVARGRENRRGTLRTKR